jgi:hypothetical protein
MMISRLEWQESEEQKKCNCLMNRSERMAELELECIERDRRMELEWLQKEKRFSLKNIRVE